MSRSIKFAAALLCAMMAWAPAAGMLHGEKEKEKEKGEKKDDGYEDAVEEGVRGAAMESYEEGKSAIEEEEWQQAVRYFNKVIAMNAAQADGALYWKSYALWHLGNMSDALKGLEELPRQFANSRWIKDAKALALELRQSGGRPVSPEKVDDEELKLIALNSLMNADPDKALPMLEKVLNGSGSPRLKEQALFVLLQNDSPRAHEIAASIARGQSNPDLQRKALEYLGTTGDEQNGRLLREVYASTSDPSVKRSILQGFMASDDTAALVNVATTEKDPDLRRGAIEMLGAQGASAELVKLYRTESEPRNREQIVRALGVAGEAGPLNDVVKSEKDPRLRRAAVQSLGIMDASESGAMLEQLYASETDRDVKRTVLEAFMTQDNAKSLIAVARKEKDLELKKHAVEMLSNMDDPAAVEYLMEILEK